MASITYRPLSTLSDFAEVVELEREIWSVDYRDVVPTPIFAITVKRGGILIGGFDGDRLIAFVYSLPAIVDGKPAQWSHMLGVVPQYRDAGVGRELKLLQRQQALAMDLDLIEWTYDPLQALNAHLNFAKLGVVVHEYEENIYGASTSMLHRGNPTDRFVAQWWIQKPHVERRIESKPDRNVLQQTVRAHEATVLGHANRVDEAGACADVDLTLTEKRVLVEIPTGFTEMLSQQPELAMTWRLATREIFTTYFGRGYEAVDFRLNRERQRGAYVLVNRTELP